MRSYSTLTLIFAAALLNACGERAQPSGRDASDTAQPAAPAVAPAAPVSKLAQLFKPDMLNAQVAYVETIIGPAKEVNGDYRDYIVDGCRVSIEAPKGAIATFGIEFKKGCSLNLGDFLGNAPAKADGITFGDLIDTGYSSTISASCLQSCGNAADPTVSLLLETDHANNFINVEGTVTLVEDPALDASGVWEEAMALEGEDYVIYGKFNCDGKYNEAGKKAFRKVRIESVRVGNIEPLTPTQLGCEN